MAKAVFIQNPSSIYNDQPGRAYHFPKRYLNAVQKTVGDWVVFYEGRIGAFGYVSVQKVESVVPDDQLTDHFYARLNPSTLWGFEGTVPRSKPNGEAYETSLRGAGGAPISGGLNVSAVRQISDADFAAIVDAGLAPRHAPDCFPRSGPLPTDAELPGFQDPTAGFDHSELDHDRNSILTSRAARDASFARQVKAAYGARCAISGLSLRNGGGRPEVNAAHIRPVAHGGPDLVTNGLALSGTIHWMFDRGLISVAADNRILVSHNKVPKETAERLKSPEQKLVLPNDPKAHPNPEFLRYHREEIFGH